MRRAASWHWVASPSARAVELMALRPPVVPVMRPSHLDVEDEASCGRMGMQFPRLVLHLRSGGRELASPVRDLVGGPQRACSMCRRPDDVDIPGPGPAVLIASRAACCCEVQSIVCCVMGGTSGRRQLLDHKSNNVRKL